MMRYNTFILFGAPGSGKGTQGKTLGTIPRYYHCACGDVFRSIDTRTKVGKAFLDYSSENRLDDANEEVIQRRLDIYEKESRPVLSYYSQELVTVVDATQPPAKVLLDILQSVNDGVYEPAAV